MILPKDVQEYLQTAANNAEQRDFEDWLLDYRPNGDVESVRNQWMNSLRRLDFEDRWRVVLDLIDNDSTEEKHD